MTGEAIIDKGKWKLEINSGKQITPKLRFLSTPPTPCPHRYYAPRRAAAGTGTGLV